MLSYLAGQAAVTPAQEKSSQKNRVCDDVSPHGPQNHRPDQTVTGSRRNCQSAGGRETAEACRARAGHHPASERAPGMHPTLWIPHGDL